MTHPSHHVSSSETMGEVPRDLRYTAEHEWVRIEGEEIVVGITDFAQDALTEVVWVEWEKDEGEAVEAMALGVCKLFGADVSVAATGVAGPSPHDGQEVGTVWMASNIGGQVKSFKVVFPFDRTQVRQFTVITVLNT